MNSSPAASNVQSEVYLKWVNAQLKKKFGAAPLTDLCSGMHDGTAFVDLIEVVAGERISEVVRSDQLSREQKLSNVRAVIQYMRSRRIRMHETRPEDIVNGQLKSIMRLTLVLAAHYKPNAVKPNRVVKPKQSSKGSGNLSLIQYAQDAALHLADSRRDASEVIHRPARPPPSLYRDAGLVEGRDLDLSSSSSLHLTRQSCAHHRQSGSRSPQRLAKSSSTQEVTSCSLGEERYRHLSRLYEELNRDHVTLRQVSEAQRQICEESLEEAAALRKALVALQKMFLEPADDSSSMLAGDFSMSQHDDDDDDDDVEADDDAYDMDGSVATERLSPTSSILMRSRVQQLEEQCRELREQVSGSRHEYHRTLGTEAGLQQRLKNQEGEVLRLKEELLKIERNCEALECRNAELENRLREQDSDIIELRATMRAKEEEISRLSTIFAAGESSSVGGSFDLHGNTVSSAQQDSQYLDRSSNLTNQVKNIETNDIRVMKQSLEKLQASLSNGSQSLLEFSHLEHCMESLVRNLNQLNRDLSAMNLPRTHAVLDGTLAESCKSNKVKVVLYLGEDETPATQWIDKRLSDIRLSDIRRLVDSAYARTCNKWRFYFRTEDPEYGLIKEEIRDGDAVVPHWKQIIMVWVENDSRH